VAAKKPKPPTGWEHRCIYKSFATLEVMQEFLDMMSEKYEWELVSVFSVFTTATNSGLMGLIFKRKKPLITGEE